MAGRCALAWRSGRTLNIHLIAVGHKMPDWVEAACDDYIRRLPPDIRLHSTLLPLIRRGKNADIERIVRDESRKLLAAVPARADLVLLDVRGRGVSSEKWAQLLAGWLQDAADIALVIGGPDGVSPELQQAAKMKISLSPMTFPHTLVRVMLVEQLYRAWSILNHHPYHRA